jgi:hypothetical protein
MVAVRCNWCNKTVNRSPSALNRVANVFCSRLCKQSFEKMKRETVEDGDEKDWLSRCLNHELELCREGYGGSC